MTSRAVVPPQLGRTLSAAAALAAVAATVGLFVAGPAAYEVVGQRFPGYAVGVLASAARGVSDVSSAVVMGALLCSLVIDDSRRRRRSLECETRGVTQALLERAAGLWVLASASAVLFVSADQAGVGLADLVRPATVVYALTGATAYVWVWLATFVAAVVVWLLAPWARSWQARAGLLAVAWAGSAVPIVMGQVLFGPDHDLGTDAALVEHVGLVALAAVVVWIGGSGDTPVAARARARACTTGVAGLVLVAAAQPLLGWFLLAGGWPWQSSTGWTWLGRLAALGLLACCLLLGRLRIPRASLGLVAAAAVYVALGSAMTRIPSPNTLVPSSTQQGYLGYDVLVPPTLGTLVTAWRLNLLFATVAALAVVAYLLAVRRLRRRGDSWPVGRTAAWLVGWGLVVLVTSSGLGRYSGPDFAVHMGVHMVLAMVVPIMLALGGGVTLALRALPAAPRDQPPGPYEWIAVTLNSRGARLLYHPLLVFGLYVSSLYVLYFSSLFEAMMSVHWGHQLMNVHFIAVGYLYFSLVIGSDPVPRALPALGKLGYLLAAMPFHAFFGIIIMSSQTVIAEDFYRRLDLAWQPDLAEVQYLGGGIAWAGSEIPLIIVVIVLAIQWAGQDARLARRTDRQLDSGLDQSHDAYNAYLLQLHQRAGAPRPAQTAPRHPGPGPRDEDP